MELSLLPRSVKIPPIGGSGPDTVALRACTGKITIDLGIPCVHVITGYLDGAVPLQDT